MQLSWSDRQKELKQRFYRFGHEFVAPGSAERDRTASFDPSVWKALAEAGFWRVHTPAGLGGDDGDLWDHLAAFEGLAKGSGDVGFVLSAAAHAGLVQLLLRHGTAEQQDGPLRRLLDGEIAATAATEDAGGSHVAAVRTVARPTSGGYVLHGHKSHITNAPVADIAMIVGRVEGLGPQDITLFLVETSQEGVHRGGHEDLIGLRTSPLGPIALDGTVVPSDHVIGAPGHGLDLLYRCLTFDRLIYGTIVAGHLESLLPVALDRIARRQAFGAPLRDFQYIQQKIVDIEVAIQSSRGLSYMAMDALNRDDDHVGALASCAKLVSADGIVQSCLELVQIFGHLGLEENAGIERHLRDSVAFRIAGGTNEMQKKNIFKQLLRRHQKERVD